MRYPWANTILLALIAVELVSGFFGLVSNSPDEAAFILAHRIAGWGIIAVLLWKARNIAASLRWARRPAPRAASLALAAALALTLALGFAWSFVGPMSFWLFSGVSWHIYIGGALVPILIWHALYHTRGFPAKFWVDRRSFLRLAGLAIAAAALWRIGETAAAIGGLSGATRRFTGSYDAGSYSGNAFPLTSWLNDNPAPISASEWRLTIRGAVANPAVLRYDDIAADAELTATLGLHRRLALHADMARRIARPPAQRGAAHRRRRERNRALGHRLLPPLFPRGGGRLHHSHARWRRNAIARTRLSRAPSSPRQARL